MSLSNIITLFRLLTLPLIIYLLFQETKGTTLLAILVLGFAVMSDVVDGHLTRQRKEGTRLGSFLDPFVDKVLIYGLLVVFSVQGYFLFSLLFLFVARDVMVLVMRWIASRDDVHIPEEKYRKWLVLAYFGILFSILCNQLFVYTYFLPGMYITYSIALLCTLLSLILVFSSIIHHLATHSKGVYRRCHSGTAIPPQKIIVLANRKSSGYHDGYRRRLLRVFAKRRNATLHYLPSISSMFEGVSRVVQKTKHIVIAGGDGSFESALNYIPFHTKSLGFFPLGSGNAFYSYFYKGKRFEYLRSRFQFREMKLDIMEIKFNQRKVQTTFLSVGCDAEVIHYRLQQKLGFFWYLWSSLQVIFHVKAQYALHCLVDGKKYFFSNCMNLTLAKVPYYGFALRSIVGEVKPSDGKVYGVAFVNTHARIWNKPVRVLGLILAAMNLNRPPLVSLKGKIMTVSSEQPFPLQAGGEFLGYTTEIKVRVVRTQKVLVI